MVTLASSVGNCDVTGAAKAPVGHGHGQVLIAPTSSSDLLFSYLQRLFEFSFVGERANVWARGW